MNVIFHVVAGASVAHGAAGRLAIRGRSAHKGGLLVATAATLALLSHGVLDGLKHGYPLAVRADVLLSAVLALAWCLLVRPPLRVLFACAIAGSLLPDVVDHTPWMLRKEVGISIPWIEHRPFFPWHWRDGSGSLRVGGAVPTRDLNQGQNRAVSLTNHLIVLSLCLGAVLTSPGAFRFVATPPP